jgi:hypothetical protein
MVVDPLIAHPQLDRRRIPDHHPVIIRTVSALFNVLEKRHGVAR